MLHCLVGVGMSTFFFGSLNSIGGAFSDYKVWRLDRGKSFRDTVVGLT